MNLVMSSCQAADAQELARRLLSERLAACCSLVPGVESIYWWAGKLTSESEVLLIFKTPTDRTEALMELLKALHPYELPEIVALPVVAVSEGYRAWLVRETLPLPE
jgi:periplasmic divalent cation tolerance protein